MCMYVRTYMYACMLQPFFFFVTAEEPIDVPLLRQQQIRLGLLKAARVLFSQQENLRQIMARPASSEGDQYSLFQQLLSAATRPSPIKVMFNRDELEVSQPFMDCFRIDIFVPYARVFRLQLSLCASISCQKYTNLSYPFLIVK